MDWFLYDNGPRHERVKNFIDQLNFDVVLRSSLLTLSKFKKLVLHFFF